MKPLRRVGFLLALPIWLSCGEAPTEAPSPVPTTARVVPPAVNLAALGQTVPLVATALDQRGQVFVGAVFIWASDNTAVATVDATGLVTAVGNGAATVSATIQRGGVTASAAVAVDQVVTEVRLEPMSLTFAAFGETRQLAAEGVDANGNTVANTSFSWSSSDESIATVSSNGLVTAVASGSVVITAALVGANLTGSSTIEVLLPVERTALTAFYNSTGGPSWEHREGWLTDAPLGSWYGVTTDEEGRVTDLFIRDNQLRGPLPPELASLTNLRRLDLLFNEITGQIPGELAQLDSLRVIRLGYNLFTGPIPTGLANLRYLERLELGANRLSGPIPPELGNLANLRALNLAQNELTGMIPPELGKLSNVDLMAFDGNNLTGPIPGELAQLPRIAHLAMGDTKLTGSIAALENLTTLTRLTLQNTNLSGRLPEGLTRMSLREFWWDRTRLCAPANEAFQRWLTMIANHRGGAKCTS